MSLVGPRPLAEDHDALARKLVPDFILRQSVRPGMTGLAQINGHRGHIPTIDCLRERVELDVWYVCHRSNLLDLQILLRTPLAIWFQANAH